MSLTKNRRRQKIKYRIRKIIHGTSAQPRLNVYRSNKQIYAQVIDDDKGVTIVSASSIEKDYEKEVPKKVNKSEQAKVVGKLISERAIHAGIKKIKFDRNGYLYHGRVKALADAAREGGLEF